MLRYNILPPKNVETFSLSVEMGKAICDQPTSPRSLTLTIHTRWGEQRLRWGHLDHRSGVGMCVCVCVCLCVCWDRVGWEGKSWAHKGLLLSALSYVGSRSSSNMAIVEVKMLSGFSPTEGTNQLVSHFSFLHLIAPRGPNVIIKKLVRWLHSVDTQLIIALSKWTTKMHHIWNGTWNSLCSFSYLSKYTWFPSSWQSFGRFPWGTGRALGLSLLFSFSLIQLLQQPLVKKVESGADTLNIYLEKVGIQELDQRAWLFMFCKFPSNLCILACHAQGWGSWENEFAATQWILPPCWYTAK